MKTCENDVNRVFPSTFPPCSFSTIVVHLGAQETSIGIFVFLACTWKKTVPTTSVTLLILNGKMWNTIFNSRESYLDSRRNMELEQVTLNTCNLSPDAQGQTLLYSCYYPGVTTSRLLQLRTISSYHGRSPCCGNGNHITPLVETRYYIRMFPVAHCIWQEFLVVA